MPDQVAVPVAAELTVAQWFLSPGKTLHSSWWPKLGLSAWEVPYQQSFPLARLIDSHIRRAVNMPAVIISPAVFSDTQKLLFRSVKRLPKLLVALGLLRLECPDYLLRREYRQRLEAVLDDMSINQLWMLWRGQAQEPSIPPERLIEAAWECGYQHLAALLPGDPLWSALRLQLPVPKDNFQHEVAPAPELVWSEFRRLERFL